MLNYIWLGLVLGAVLLGGWNDRLKEVAEGAFTSARGAVIDIALPLAGIMALWLGLMRLAEKSGLVGVLARLLRPVMTRLFPEVPATHPAMGSMLMNMAANMLGLSNAATPLGLRAMRDLETLNPRPGTASNAMCTFLAINTSSLQLIPATAVGILAARGSTNPSSIIGTAFMATLCATTSAIVAVKLLEKLAFYRLRPVKTSDAPPKAEAVESEDRAGRGETAIPPWLRAAPLILGLYFIFFAWSFCHTAFPQLFGGELATAARQEGNVVRAIKTISLLAIPLLLSFIPLYAALRQIKVYEEFVEGAKEGFPVILRIIPYLVAMLVAIGMFRGAGGIDLLTRGLTPVLGLIHFPPELLPLALMRPLSGSGTLGVFSELVNQYGPDHLLSRMAGTIYGSTETTFYVLAVYFGAVNIKRTRHAVPAGLIADAVGVAASVVICRLVFG